MGRLRSSRRSLFYSFDAAVALFIIAGAVIFFSFQHTSSVPTLSSENSGQDIISGLNSIRAGDSDYPTVIAKITAGEMTERQKDSSLLEYISDLWAEGDEAYAQLIIQDVLSSIPMKNVAVMMNASEIYDDGLVSSNVTSVASSRIMTGITQERVIKGVSVRTYLSGIGNKLTSSFVFFGGFIGQGDVSARGAYLPSDANVTSVEFQADLGGNATLYINGVECSTFTTSGVNTYDISSCNSSLTKGGESVFLLMFEGDELSYQYVGGGVIEVKYRTSEFSQVSFDSQRYWLPGVDGLVNLYSSVNVPGELKTMNIHLHYDVNSSDIGNASFILMLGNKTVYNDTASAGQSIVDLDNTYLSSVLDYSIFNSSTVPMRLGFTDILKIIGNESGNADVILITDMSGSMKKSISSNADQGNANIDCDNLAANPNARKTALAKCLDKIFVEIVMNSTGNRVWPVQIYDEVIDPMPSSDDWALESDIITEIDSYNGAQGKGKTCLSCALNEAYDILDTYSDPTRKKFVILMTDGVPTHCPQGGCTSTSSVYGNKICDGYCDVTGNNCGIPIGCNDNSCQAAVDSTLFSTNRIYNDLNVTINTIGFGLISECSTATSLLTQIAGISNGTYATSSNVSVLLDIYKEFAEEIVKSSRYSQIMNITQGSISNTTLFDDSYINVTYEPSLSDLPAGHISIKMITPEFSSCTPTIDLPHPPILDAYVTSFSGIHWTDMLKVNGEKVFDLSTFYNNYTFLGDPFILTVPPSKLTLSSTNSLEVNIGDSPTESFGCSPESRMAYTIIIPISASQSEIYDRADGCNWTIEYYDGTYSNLVVPKDYTGVKQCLYDTTTIDYGDYDSGDGVDVAVKDFLDSFDIDLDGDLDVKIDENEFSLETVEVNEIPGLWGPSIFKVVVSR